MIAELEIRSKVAEFLDRKIFLQDFEDWLVEKSWNMHLDSTGEAQNLASFVELRLAEHSSGHLSEADLRAELVPLCTVINLNSAYTMTFFTPPGMIVFNPLPPEGVG